MLLLAGDVWAQNLGVKFDKKLTWKDLAEKAHSERKYIFMDCYTTWCGPCRFMADSIFTKRNVGEFINERYVSAQVQMDSSKNDNEFVKSWYKDANAILNTYKISAFPTYLFFNPEGKIVHVGVGVKDENDFIKLAADALDTSKQYYVLLEKYEAGRIEFESLPQLAYTSKELGYKNVALKIAEDYMRKYLDQLPDSDFCQKKHLQFIADFYNVFNSGDRIFNLYYRQSMKIDSIMQIEGYAKSFVDYIITKEEIAPVVAASKIDGVTPDWDLLFKRIQKRYDMKYAECNVLNAKVGWYKDIKDWKKYTHYLVQSIEANDVSKLSPGAGNVLYLNNSAWEIFQHSNNIEELKKAIYWVDAASLMTPEPSAALIDTKSNLLYKIGKTHDAIKLQNEAISLEPTYHEFQITLEKMKRGMPTWGSNNVVTQQ